jgi:hypothetical protein
MQRLSRPIRASGKKPAKIFFYIFIALFLLGPLFSQDNYVLREMERDTTLWADKEFHEYLQLGGQQEYMTALTKYPGIKKRFKKHQILLASAAMYYQIVGLNKEAKKELLESYKISKDHQFTLMLLVDLAEKEQNEKDHAKYVLAGLRTYGDLNFYFLMACTRLTPRKTQLPIARKILVEAQKSRIEDIEIEIIIDVFDTMLATPLRPGFETRYQKIMATKDKRLAEMAEKVRETNRIVIPGK